MCKYRSYRFLCMSIWWRDSFIVIPFRIWTNHNKPKHSENVSRWLMPDILQTTWKVKIMSSFKGWWSYQRTESWCWSTTDITDSMKFRCNNKMIMVCTKERRKNTQICVKTRLFQCKYMYLVDAAPIEWMLSTWNSPKKYSKNKFQMKKKVYTSIESWGVSFKHKFPQLFFIHSLCLFFSSSILRIKQHSIIIQCLLGLHSKTCTYMKQWRKKRQKRFIDI